ncbi:DapH/DapD/GlmU-related protein [Prevotella sp. 10(H)]|uniref:acyltransferase n=1 Tax=Prevotella sp. 10(H) TaxID=1158294 RepID=UPI001E53520F|nr:acyltransferase [Prevotella sp. 10(H)]
MDEYWLDDYIKLGMKVGNNCSIQPGLTVDVSHCWLIEIADNVVIAPQVYLLAHDTSTKKYTGYTKIGRINIKKNVFIGARSMIMPGVTIGENSVIGANSVVIKSIPDNVVAAGNPAKVICSLEEYQEKTDEIFRNAHIFSDEYTLRKKIDRDKKQQMRVLLTSDKAGFVE